MLYSRTSGHSSTIRKQSEFHERDPKFVEQTLFIVKPKLVYQTKFSLDTGQRQPRDNPADIQTIHLNQMRWFGESESFQWNFNGRLLNRNNADGFAWSWMAILWIVKEDEIRSLSGGFAVKLSWNGSSQWDPVEFPDDSRMVPACKRDPPNFGTISIIN